MMFDEIHMKYTTSRCTNNIQHDVLMKYTYICKYHHFNVQNAQLLFLAIFLSFWGSSTPAGLRFSRIFGGVRHLCVDKIASREKKTGYLNVCYLKADLCSQKNSYL